MLHTFFKLHVTTCGWGAFLDHLEGKVTNEEIRKEQDKHLSRRWSEKEDCNGHVTRMDKVCTPKQALQSEVAGFKRRPGRPRINCRDIVNKDLQRMGLTSKEVKASAQERQTWRQRVALCISDAGWIKFSQACKRLTHCHQHSLYVTCILYYFCLQYQNIPNIWSFDWYGIHNCQRVSHSINQ